MAIIYGSELLCVLSILFILNEALTWLNGLIAFFIFAIGIVLPTWLVNSTYYLVDDSALLVRSGPLTWRIALSDIQSVSATKNPLSSPALSLDRLRIDYGRMQSVMVSPADKQAFLDAIKQEID